MSDNQQPSLIGQVFPLVPKDALPNLLLGLTARDSAIALAMHSESETAFDNIAKWMLSVPSTSLGSILPGLWLARDDRINSPNLPVRNVVALNRLGVTVWGDVLELTASHLLDIRGFGEGSLQTFLAVAACVSVTACCSARPPTRCPTVDVFEPRLFAPRLGFRVRVLRRLADWAANEEDASNIADLLGACLGGQMPDDIAELLETLRQTRLVDIFPDVARTETLGLLVTDLYGVLDPRKQTIFLGRISLYSLRTLEDLASELGITRERVRQLSVQAEERILDALKSSRFAPIGWRAHSLALALGTAVPPGPLLDAAIERVARGVPVECRERVMDLLFWIAGPYTRDSVTGWLRNAELPSPTLVAECSDERGRVDVDRVLERLAAGGLTAEAQTAWIDQVGKVKFVDGRWLLWDGSMPDKAARLLELWGNPATPEQIVLAIDEGHEIRSARNRLFDDERFVRVDMTRVGLRSWGMEEYSSIAEEIEKELEARGGVADLDDLIATLVDRFSLRETSIRSYAYAPMFVREGKTIRRRQSGDAHDPVAPVTEVPCCYLLGSDVLTWRVEVTADTIRGSGRQLPASIAAWLGLMPGGRKSFNAAGSTVGVTWPETSALGAALGSIRPLIHRIGASLGDQLLLRFDRDNSNIEASLVDPLAVSEAQCFRRLSLLTGIPHVGGDDSFLQALGVALGTRGTRAAIASEFRRRGEEELAALMPPEATSPDLDAAIDAMADLF
jgi:hypothetical protein